MAKAGDVFRVFTNTITIKVASTDNGGHLAMFVDEAPPGAGVPMHVHWKSAETLFVLSGRYRISVGGKIHEVRTGDGAFLPANIPHAYKNISDDVGRLLFTVAPGGLEGFFEEISRSGLQPPSDMPAINRIAAKYHHEIVGPPIA